MAGAAPRRRTGGPNRAGTTAARRRSPLRIGIILADHFTLSAFALFTDHLRLAADEGDRSRPLHVRWSIMSARSEAVVASCGVALQPTGPLLPPEDIDYLVVVGGILHAGPQIDTHTERYLREVARTDVPIVGICTGSFILCRAGLMRGRRSCVSWYHHADFQEAFPGQAVVADRLFLVDGPRITCAGGAGTAALASYLIERHLGRALAEKASQVLLFDGPRAGHEPQPHPPMATEVDDPRIKRALLMMEQNLVSPLPIASIAAGLGLSARQLERLCRAQLGMGPAGLYRRLRLRYASWLIENTDRSVTEIAVAAGFADCAHFSRRYKDTYGLSPSRRRLQPRHGARRDAARGRVYEAG